MKVCRRCRVLRPFDAFHRARHRRDGLRSDCRSCRTELDREYRDRRRAGGVLLRDLVDDMAVVRAVDGDPPSELTPAERREVVRVLTHRRLSAAAIAVRIRATPDTVHRARTRLGLVPATCGRCAGRSCPWHATSR